MSYVQQILRIKETVLEYRNEYLVVPTGDTAPAPADGYSVQLALTDIAGVDLYIEYKVTEQDHICPS